jgi:pimeloyl-ACP methyl ester carboxylesterase
LLAERYRVAALVLCNSFVVHPWPRIFRLLAVPLLFRIRPPDTLLVRYLVGPRAPRELLARIRAALAAVSPKVLASRVRTVLGVNVARQLARCTMPLLYLRGTDDRLVTESSVDAVVNAATVPVSVARIAGPHLLLQIAPEAAWQAISETILRSPTG